MTYWPFTVIGGVTVVSLVAYLSWPWLSKHVHRWCCGSCAADRRKSREPLYVPGDWVDEWIAEYQRKNQHPAGCKCRTCSQREPRPGGAL